MNTIYLDSAATAPLDMEVAAGLLERERSHFANPASSHPLGRKASAMLEDSRERLARQIGASPEEIIFTSGGTEALLLGICGSAGESGGRIAISAVEHSAVFEAAKTLTGRGYELVILPVDTDGRVTAEALAQHIDRQTRIVSIMMAQNEVGSINDIAALGRVIRSSAPRAKFVVDAVQAFAKIPIDVDALDVDCLAFTSHKIHGPKGIGALYSRHQLKPVMKGGGQERGQRGGTQSGPLAWAFAEAASKELSAQPALRKMRDHLWAALKQRIPNLELVGPKLESEQRLAMNLNVMVPRLPSEPLLNALSGRNLCASAGSACTTGEFSKVLTAMGRKSSEGAFIRLTLGRHNIDAEMDEAAARFADAVTEISALYL